MVNDAGDENGVKPILKIGAYVFNTSFVSKSFEILEKKKTGKDFEFFCFYCK